VREAVLGQSVCPQETGDLHNPNPQCVVVTRDEYYIYKASQATLEKQTQMLELHSSFSRLPIKNAFMDKCLPLSDLIHGVNCMSPPETLHTTSEGCTKYIFETLVKLIYGTTDLMDSIEKLYFTIHHG
jgi:hypothetical protein